MLKDAKKIYWFLYISVSQRVVPGDAYTASMTPRSAAPATPENLRNKFSEPTQDLLNQKLWGRGLGIYDFNKLLCESDIC